MCTCMYVHTYIHTIEREGGQVSFCVRWRSRSCFPVETPGKVSPTVAKSLAGLRVRVRIRDLEGGLHNDGRNQIPENKHANPDEAHEEEAVVKHTLLNAMLRLVVPAVDNPAGNVVGPGI